MPDIDLAGYARLRQRAVMHADVQQLRIRLENRAMKHHTADERRALRQLVTDPSAFSAAGPEVDPEFLLYAQSIREVEHQMALALRKEFRAVAPKGVLEWAADTQGIAVTGRPPGLLPQLLGFIGHPRWATPHHWEGTGEDRRLVADEPYERTVSQLWSFCGHGDPARRPRKGVSSEELFAAGNPRAKVIVHLMAIHGGKMQKPRPGQLPSPYRLLYDETKERYADTGRTPMHVENIALRRVGKEILLDLWRAANNRLAY